MDTEECECLYLTYTFNHLLQDPPLLDVPRSSFLIYVIKCGVDTRGSEFGLNKLFKWLNEHILIAFGKFLRNYSFRRRQMTSKDLSCEISESPL